MKKLILLIFGFVFIFIWSWFAQKYILFYAEACPHCQEVEKFIIENNVDSNYGLNMKEVRKNKDNLLLFSDYLKKVWLTIDESFVPFLIIEDWADCGFVEWSYAIKSYFSEKMWLNIVCDEDEIWTCKEESICEISEQCEEHVSCQVGGLLWEKEELWDGVSLWKKLSFFGVMLPAALADSINPCAFAVMLLLLSWILSRENSRKKTLLAGLLFSLAIFLTYLLMGIWLFSALATAQNTFVIKIVVWILWIVVWLANLKDYFWYGKWFVMEVPFGWRPNMKKIIDRAVSPLWAFVVGIIISLFLLPCTSGPYFTILWYLASESSSLNLWGYIYLISYNVVFVVPMLIITILVSAGFKSAEELSMLKNKHKKLIHLIVGILMFGLWLYVLLTM